MKLGWYLHRIGRMSAGEIASRTGVALRQRAWRHPRLRPDGLKALRPGPRVAAVALRRPAPGMVAPAAAAATVAAAERLLAGEWPLFHLRPATVGTCPDWHRDPASGIRSDPDTYAFAVPYRDEAQVGNAKYVWELSRHQATTVLAAAWWLTGDDRFAERVREHLADWWARNPFLHGMHWTGGIEAGLRLISWVWIRALLADWPGAGALFDGNDAFARQLRHHLLYLRHLHSRGSSSNNHVLAEFAGAVAACEAFPWFSDSDALAAWARSELAIQAELQTHGDGFNREQASEYGPFVWEILAATALATRMAGQPGLDRVEAVMARMADAVAASLDAAGQPPRFGDGDDGRGVLLDAPDTAPERVVLDVGGVLAGRAAWWPTMAPTVLGAIARQLAGEAPEREGRRPDDFPGAGVTLLRHGEGAEEIYVRCDAGPHGYLSIAAHGHADALSLEARYGNTVLLADPGTYCYHGEPEWRGYFRGTSGHNTLAVDGEDQARIGGPFLWLDKPATERLDLSLNGPVLRWSARHDGYRRLADPVTHARAAALDTRSRVLAVEDWIEASEPHVVSLAFHLGPAIDLVLEGCRATLRWPGHAATLDLPEALAWTAHRGETAPPLGWYSPGFGRRVPAWTLLGRGTLAPGERLCSALRFPPAIEASTTCDVMGAAF